jgi:hypothetical protein
MAHAIENDTPMPDNTAAASSEEVQLGTTRSSDADGTHSEPEDINLSALEPGGDSHVEQTQCSPTFGIASRAADSGAKDAAVDSGAEPQELQQLLEALQAISNADSLAAQQRLLSLPAPVTSHDADSGERVKSVPALDGSAALDDRHDREKTSPHGSSDQQGPHEPGAVQQQAAGAGNDSSSSSFDDGWSPACRATGTPRAAGASQAAARSRSGSQRSSAAGQAPLSPSSGAAAGDTGDAGAAGGAGQRPRSGGARGRPRRWSGAAAPGVQLYGRVHAWKEGNKQRWGLAS